MPTDEHAGRTSLCGGIGRRPHRGALSGRPDAEAYAFLRTGYGLGRPRRTDGEARLLPRNPLGLQDNRTWDIPASSSWAPATVGSSCRPAQGSASASGIHGDGRATAAEMARRRPLGMDLTDDRPLEILSVTLGSPGHGAATPGRERTGPARP